MMSLVRLLGFTNLSCGCVTGHYRELATNREITYVEEKGSACNHHDHRRNHTLAPARFRMSASDGQSLVVEAVIDLALACAGAVGSVCV